MSDKQITVQLTIDRLNALDEKSFDAILDIHALNKEKSMSKLLTLLAALVLEKFTVEFGGDAHFIHGNAMRIHMSLASNHIERIITSQELTMAVNSDELVIMHLRDMYKRLQHAAATAR